MRASSGGGRDGAPYLAVTIGDCLTYAYDAAAVESYRGAWAEAVHIARTRRLPEHPTTPGQRLAPPGEDFAVACTVRGAQDVSVHGHTPAGGRPVIAVAVGSVTVHVHTGSAAASCLHAWTRAATVTALLEDA